VVLKTPGRTHQRSIFILKQSGGWNKGSCGNFFVVVQRMRLEQVKNKALRREAAGLGFCRINS
jgi:hypothetical protein